MLPNVVPLKNVERMAKSIFFNIGHPTMPDGIVETASCPRIKIYHIHMKYQKHKRYGI